MERFKLKQTRANKVYALCRLCGMDNPGKVRICDQDDDILSLDDDDPPLNRKIEVCTGIIVDINDNLPQMCCNICTDKICDFYEFRLMCTSTDIQTRKILGLPPSKIKDEKPDIKNIECIKMEIMQLDSGMKTGKEHKRRAASPVENKIISNSGKCPDFIFDVDINPMICMKRIKIDNPIPKIKCSICETTFTNEQDLFGHKYVKHIPTTSIKYGCTSCGYALTDLKDWNSHKLWHNKFHQPFVCGRCEANFFKYIDFSKHHQMNACTAKLNIQIIDIRCELCRKKFATQNLYQWHGCFIKNRGNCRKCGQYFTKKLRLFEHYIECKLPFIDFPKIEATDTGVDIHENIIEVPETSAAAPPFNIKRPRYIQSNQMVEKELIIKAESVDLSGKPCCIESTSALSQIADATEVTENNCKSFENGSRPSKSKKKTKHSCEELHVIRVKSEIEEKRSDSTLNNTGKQGKKLYYDKNLMEGGLSDLSNIDPAIAILNNIAIKQENPTADYGDLPYPCQYSVNSSNTFNISSIKIETESPVEALPICVKIEREEITKEKTTKLVNRISRKRKSKDLAVNFLALAKRIKKEKASKHELPKSIHQYKSEKAKETKPKFQRNNKRSFVKINPLATIKDKKTTQKVRNPLAKVKLVASGSEKFTLKIKKESIKGKMFSKKHSGVQGLVIKKEPQDHDENVANYLGLNPLSFLFQRKSDTMENKETNVNCIMDLQGA